MPLGVSEALLQKAYGPTDFSGFYKQIDAASKRIAAQDAAQKQSDLKEASITKASLMKEQVGVRAEDKADAINLYNKWGSIKRRQTNISSSRNPEAWGKLESEANSIQQEYSTRIQLSKDMSKSILENKKELSNPERSHYYADNSLSEFNKNTFGKSTRDILKNNHHFLDTYLRKDIDATKFDDAFDKYLNGKNSTQEHSNYQEYSENGVKQYKKQDWITPNWEIISNGVHNALDKGFSSQNQKKLYAEQQLKEAENSGDYNRVDNLLKAKKEEYKKLGVPIPEEFDINKGQGAIDIYSRYMTAKAALSLYNKKSEGKGEYGSKYEEQQASEKSRLKVAGIERGWHMEDFKKKAQYTKSLLGDMEPKSILPMFDAALSSGSAHLEVAKAIPDILGPNFYAAGVKPSITKIPEFQAGSEALNFYLKGGNLKQKDFITDKTTYKQVADKINELNNENGIITKISSTEVREGQLILHDLGIGADGKTRKMIVYGMKDKLSRNQLDFGVKGLETTSKQKRAELTKGIMTGNLIGSLDNL